MTVATFKFVIVEVSTVFKTSLGKARLRAYKVLKGATFVGLIVHGNILTGI